MQRNHPYQLRSIEVRDFKSIEHASVDLHPITIVIGANSSGKSSLLQIVLALAQVIRSKRSGPTFPLNGEYARFGNFEETVRFTEPQGRRDAIDKRRIEVGVVMHGHYNYPFFFRDPKEGEFPEEDPTYIEWRLDLARGQSSDSGSASLDAIEICAYNSKQDGTQINLFEYKLRGLTSMESDDQHRDHPIIAGMENLSSGQITLTSDDSYFAERTEDDVETKVNCGAVRLREGMPEAVYTLCTFGETIGRRWWQAVERHVMRRRYGAQDPRMFYEGSVESALDPKTL